MEQIEEKDEQQQKNINDEINKNQSNNLIVLDLNLKSIEAIAGGRYYDVNLPHTLLDEDINMLTEIITFYNNKNKKSGWLSSCCGKKNSKKTKITLDKNFDIKNLRIDTIIKENKHKDLIIYFHKLFKQNNNQIDEDNSNWFNCFSILLNCIIFNNFEKISILTKSQNKIDLTDTQIFLDFSRLSFNISKKTKENQAPISLLENPIIYDISELIEKIYSFITNLNNKSELILQLPISSIDILPEGEGYSFDSITIPDEM
ncbi:MAG: hypothetical protein N4A49_11030 [Marinifilaceae bacterium]|jgi:hypothetical protein|nr:hypothetical protein [Marinifilaceae bacterium]